MEMNEIIDEHLRAAEAFAALGSEARLSVVRALVRAEPEGLAVGALQERLGMPGSTLSHHLRHLAQVGVIEQRRDGRRLVCRARIPAIEALAAYLTRECCRDARCDDDATGDATGG